MLAFRSVVSVLVRFVVSSFFTALEDHLNRLRRDWPPLVGQPAPALLALARALRDRLDG
jgi:hypothetical protein